MIFSRTLLAILFVFVSIAGLYSGARLTNIFEPKKSDLKILAGSLPSSADPLKYDYAKNHALQSMMHLRVVSFYRGHGGPSPQLAKTWKTNSSHTEWAFNIRNDLSFSSGTPLGPEEIEKSLRRIVFLLRKQGSENEFVNSLVGIEKFTDLTSKLPGLSFSGDQLFIKLNKPLPDLLEILAFGTYSIVDEKNFDRKTGDWLPKDIQSVSGVGPYQATDVSASTILLRLKAGFPSDLKSESAFSEVIFSTDASVKPDIGFGPADLENFSGGEHRFYGRGSRNIMYAFLLPWQDEENPLSRVSVRQALKAMFHAELSAAGLPITNSFFPVIMPGISEPTVDKTKTEVSTNLKAGAKLRFNDPRPIKSKNINLVVEAFESAVKKIGLEPVGIRGVPIDAIHKSKMAGATEFPVDVALLGTGISIENPMSDIRLMFSPEGINLPDLDGSIREELGNRVFVPQRINQKLSDQGLIIPISRYDLGVWAHNSLDLSNYNTLLPLGELQWIGVK
jgi:hypothetical protein